MSDDQQPETTPEHRWTDRHYPVPATHEYGLTGAQEIARQLFDQIGAWGHQVDDVRYIEETEVRTGLTGDTVRALRFECTADGHAVSIRHDYQAYECEQVWAVTVDGTRRPHGMPNRWLFAGKLAGLARTVHRAIS